VALIESLKPTNYPPWLEKKIKNALQGKGVRQVKKFHLQDERNLLRQDVLHDEPILRNQVTKGMLAKLMFHQMIKVVIHKLIMMLLLIRFYLD
jgi:hypothetical protein